MNERSAPGSGSRQRPPRRSRRRDGCALAESRLLYVEDDTAVREQLVEYLQRRVKELYVADDGRAGLRLFEQSPPDIVLTDILMPRMDGLSMARQIKLREPTLPIIVTSAFSDSAYLMQAIELGIERYVLKPIDTTRLEDALAFCASAARDAHSWRLSQAVVDSASDAVAIMDAEGCVVKVNPSFLRITGWAPEAIVGGHIDALVDPAQTDFLARLQSNISIAWRGEFQLRCADGAWLDALGSLDPVVGVTGRVDYRLLMFFDNSENRRSREQMRHLAHFDSLTGLPNRLLFDDALRQTLAEARAAGSQFGLLFVDLDRFKQVNDNYGHAVGDLLLREVARRLSASVREDDLVSRRSGDEFVVLLRALGSADEAHAVAERVRAAMQQAFELDGYSIAARCSVGVAIYPGDGEDARNLLRRADLAMYRAKAAGGDRSCAGSSLTEQFGEGDRAIR